MPENVSKYQTFDGVEHDIEDTTARTALDNVYTKTETDTLLAGKVDNDEIYDKHTLNQILDSKADEADVYSKTDADALLALKANAADVYTKTEADDLLAAKANAADVYSKTDADALLSAKADTTTVDAALALKANAADVYTITQSDALLDAKAGIDDSSTTATMMTWSAEKLNVDFNGKADTSDVYTKAEVDALIGGIKMMPLLDFANPLVTLDGTTKTFTTTKECYLCGCLQFRSDTPIGSGLKINNTLVIQAENFNCPIYISPLKVGAGSLIEISGNVTTNWAKLSVYEEV